MYSSKVAGTAFNRPSSWSILGAPAAEDYLADLERLATGDPATQVEIFADAESRATLTPNPSSTLTGAT